MDPVFRPCTILGEVVPFFAIYLLVAGVYLGFLIKRYRKKLGVIRNKRNTKTLGKEASTDDHLVDRSYESAAVDTFPKPEAVDPTILHDSGAVDQFLNDSEAEREDNDNGFSVQIRKPVVLEESKEGLREEETPPHPPSSVNSPFIGRASPLDCLEIEGRDKTFR